MKFKNRLPDHWAREVSKMEEFANGATQVTVRLKNGTVISRVLISDATYVVAVKDHSDLPFPLEEIESIWQTAEDKNPAERGGWEYWDRWE